MKRRTFLKGSLAGGLAAGAIAAPAIAQTSPEIKWRLASSYPKNLDTLYGGAEMLCKIVAEMTDNKFQIRAFAGGEIVPGLGVLDAVQNNTVPIGQTATYYYIGKDPAFAFGTIIPWGMNTREQMAWRYQGGGIEIFNEFLKPYNVAAFPMTQTGAQMGGFFRKEIKTVADLKGLKFRIGGMGGMVLSKLGVVPTQIAGGDLYPALEKGTIDAAEWVGPYDDERLGLYKVAPNYYYPGFWEGSAEVSAVVNLDEWNKLPKNYQAVLKSAFAHVNSWTLAKYDADNPAALRRLIAKGTKLRPFSRDILEKSYVAAFELYGELSAKHPTFKKIYDHYHAFRTEENLWFRVAEQSFDNINLVGDAWLRKGK